MELRGGLKKDATPCSIGCRVCWEKKHDPHVVSHVFIVHRMARAVLQDEQK